MTEAKAKRVPCGGCGRKMNELKPQNREPRTGKSYHYDCLGNYVSAGLKARK